MAPPNRKLRNARKLGNVAQANAVPALETRCLFLKPLALDDAAAIQALFPHWEIVRYLTKRVPWPYPPDGALTYLHELALPGMAEGTEWHWSLRLKTEPGQLVGLISLREGEDENRGFWLGLPWQGQGLMSEAAAAVTDFWFDVLGRSVLRVPKAADNIASRRISESAGMHVIRSEMRDYVSGRHLSEIWEISAERWRRHRNS